MDSNLDSMLIENELIVPVSLEFRNDLSPEDFEQLCRLCGNSNPQLMPIFSDDGNEHNLPDKIREHLPIIQVGQHLHYFNSKILRDISDLLVIRFQEMMFYHSAYATSVHPR